MSGEDVIAVDGPGGSGKSTVSRRVAQVLGWRHLDTGAFYRAATLAAIRAAADPADEAQVLEAVRAARFEQEDGRMMLDGVDVEEPIRSEEVTGAVSVVSAHPHLRRHMVELQRQWVADHGGRAVVEGRDIGTVVFPAARVKVYLSADPAERARRRARERGEDPESHVEALRRRDRLDSGRRASPLRPAEDAVVIDTTELTIDEVVGRIVGLATDEQPGRQARLSDRFE